MIRHPARLWLLWAVWLFVGGCLPTDRLNSSCAWAGDSTFRIDPSDRAHRKHLELDVRLAEDLGIRYGDAVGPRLDTEENIRPRRECTEALLTRVMALHQVGRADVVRATGARDVAIDILTIFLPILVLFGVAADRVARRVLPVFDPDDRWIRVVALVVLALIFATFGLIIAEMWAWMVETIRLRNSHISYRAFRTPVVWYRLEVWISAALVFGAVTVLRARGIVAQPKESLLGLGRRAPWRPG